MRLEIELRCILFPIDHPWDVSTTWLESTCGKFNWLDMIWKGTHLSIQGPTVHSACQSKNQSHEVETIVQDCVEAEIWGRVPKHFCSIEGSRTQKPPSFLNGRGLETPRLFLELASQAKLSNRGRRALVREVLQHSTNQTFMVEWPD